MNLADRTTFTSVLVLLLVPAATGCFGGGGYMMMGGAKSPVQTGGSMPSVNSMSVPICEVDVTALSMPDKRYKNEEKSKVFLEPGQVRISQARERWDRSHVNGQIGVM